MLQCFHLHVGITPGAVATYRVARLVDVDVHGGRAESLGVGLPLPLPALEVGSQGLLLPLVKLLQSLLPLLPHLIPRQPLLLGFVHPIPLLALDVLLRRAGCTRVLSGALLHLPIVIMYPPIGPKCTDFVFRD